MPWCEKDALNILLLVATLLLSVRIAYDYGPELGLNWGDSPESGRSTAGSHHSGLGHPTPTSIPGPQALRPLVSKCTTLKEGTAPHIELCGFKSVRQIFTNPHKSYYMGFFKGWQTGKDASGKDKLVGQLYAGGDNCPGFGDRQTLVKFTCDPEAQKEPRFVSLAEADPCKYELTIATHLWCGVEAEPLQSANASLPTVSPPAAVR